MTAPKIADPAKGETVIARKDMVVLNPVLDPRYANPLAARLLAQKTQENIIDAAEGLPLVRMSDDCTVLASLARFPVALNRAGKPTGGLMNITDYARLKTGKAWNEKHRDRIAEIERVKDDHGNDVPLRLDVVTEKEAEALSKELDALRKEYFTVIKAAHAAIATRKDYEMTALRIQPSKKGLRVSTAGLIALNVPSEADRLRAELAKRDAQIKAYEEALPAKALKRLRAKAVEPVIDVNKPEPAPALVPVAGEAMLTAPIVDPSKAGHFKPEEPKPAVATATTAPAAEPKASSVAGKTPAEVVKS